MKRFLSSMFSLTSVALSSVALAGGGAAPPNPLQPLLDFARRQPQDMAVQLAEVQAGGTLKPLLSWNAQAALPLASSRKIVVLAAYAEAVGAGRLDPQTPVTLAEWEAYYLPALDGGAHPASLKALGLGADRLGQAQEPEKTVPLDTLARFMIETSDNAATDYLMVRLGPAALAQTVTRLGLSRQEPLSPLSGWMANLATVPGYLTLPLAERSRRNWETAQQVKTRPALKQTVLQAVEQMGEPELARRLDLTDTRGAAGEYARLMAGVLSGQGLTDAELAVMRRHLGWPARLFPEASATVSPWYAKGGSLPGILTNTYAFTPQAGPQRGKSFVATVFLRRVPGTSAKRLNTLLAGDGLLLLTLDSAQQRLLLSALK